MDDEKTAKAKFDSYKAGWIVGAQNLPDISEVGTREPAHLEEWRRGHKEGSLAFQMAMTQAWERVNNIRVRS